MRENSWVFAQQKRVQPKLIQPFIQPNILSLKECQYIVDSLIPQQLKQSWTTYRHSAFPTIDIPIKTTPCLQYLIPILYERLIEPIIAPYYGFAPLQLGFRDVFLVLYDADHQGPFAQTGLAPHTDGSLISFNILINSPNDYEGGGTFFYVESSESSLNPSSSNNTTTNSNTTTNNNNTKGNNNMETKKGTLIKPSNTGDCVIHCGKTMHQGVDITKGKRMIIVGFIETFETIENDQSTTLRNM
ncbi:unnamed protein product [Cunninghamella blakesleeana]